MPVRVVKHCSRKFSDSRTSNPDGGSGRVMVPADEAELRFAPGVGMGLRRAVMAWTLEVMGVSKDKVRSGGLIPMESPSEDEIVVGADFV